MIEAKKLAKTYHTGDIYQEVLKGIDLSIADGEFLSITGKSGSGKSTLVYQLSLLDSPTSGQVLIDGRDTAEITDREKTVFRLTYFGFVFQDYAILPDLTAIENVALPLLMRGGSKEEAYKKSKATLERFGLGAHLEKLPSQLSGGEQQRVSIARAIVGSPRVLFADEPTANLDSETSETILEIFKGLHDEGQTIVMITHEKEYTELAERIIQIKDGVIVKDTRRP